ncbi:hypothetical protein EMGBD1_22500 [Anaerolineaceae bacterium]|nr:hypothetical protein EMGBD1_22500 [Anaerolineaceae bacterium]
MTIPAPFPPPAARVDPRDLKAGYVVSDRNGYYDSQNIVAVGGRDGSTPVLCVVLHHSENHEGGPGLRLYSTRSTDLGRTWTPLLAIDDSLTRQSHDGYQLVHVRPDGSERIFVSMAATKAPAPITVPKPPRAAALTCRAVTCSLRRATTFGSQMIRRAAGATPLA